MAETDTLLHESSLPIAKQSQIDQWILQRAAAGAQRIPRRGSQDALPLTFSQERFWFLDHLMPGSTVYNLPLLMRLRGPIDHALLERCLNTVVARHEVLRTTFPQVNGEPVQVIAAELPLTLPLVDLGAVGGDAEAALRAFVEEQMNRPFGLADGPLLRAALLRRGENEHALLLVMHHIISDGWSLRVLLAELTTLYAALAAGKPAALPDLPIQYADFAIWQRRRFDESAFQSQLDYWTDKLSGQLPVLQFPFARPRPAVQTQRAAWHYLDIPAERMAALKELSQREGVTLFVTLLAAFKTLLYRYTDQVDILIGTPIANRNRKEIEGLIGLFVNTLVLRSDLAGEPAFRTLLKRVHATAVDAYAHADMPFEKVVQAVRPERATNRTPIFQVMFILQNIGVSATPINGFPVQLTSVHNHAIQFDLVMEMSETASRIGYNTDLFDADTIARMARHFETLLGSIVVAPDQTIAQLRMLPPEERKLVVDDWNATERPIPQDICLHWLFEAQVERTPDAVALVCDGEQLTYRTLNNRANQLAQFLQARGVRPDMLVGICMERSLEMIVAIYAAIKAGGAYLPLDPVYPRERLAFMVEDARPVVILTHQALAERLPAAAAVICLDTLDIRYASVTVANPASQVTPDNMIYLIYTSGSTGKPKGTMISHRTLANHNQVMARRFGFGPNDRLMQFASISFDAAAVELFPALQNGGRLMLYQGRLVGFDQEFLELITREQLTVLNLPTAYWHQWVQALVRAGQTLPACLRIAHVGGEKAALEHLTSWLRIAGDRVAWINGYGPTEATITTTLYQAPADPAVLPYHEVPIGKPLTNMQVYLLDRRMQPVPIGVPGEMYIGGGGIARGYLNRPDITAERFVPNPFADFRFGILDFGLADAVSPIQNPKSKIQNGERLYRTGDLARWLPDGEMEFIGRADHQVKIRGFRVELSEIETMLRQHETIADAAVIVREDTPDDKRLIAYVVRAEEPRTKPALPFDPSPPLRAGKLRSREVEGNQEPALEDGGWKIEDGTLGVTGQPSSILDSPSSILGELRRHLKEHLPDYMIPSAFVILDAFPLTPNRKIDFAKLPLPDSARPALESTYIAPRTDLERTIAGIWQDLLRIEQVGVDDNFFDLGGHSLLLIRMHSRLSAEIAREIKLVDLFQYTSVAALAGYLHTQEPPRALPEHSQIVDAASRQREAIQRQQLKARKIRNG